MCNPFTLIASCFASCCCNAFGSAFGDANPFLGHLLIFFVTCVFAMIMKFLVEAHVTYPYTDTAICDTNACVGNGMVFRSSFCLSIFFAAHAMLCLVPGCHVFHAWGMFLKFLCLVGFIVGSLWVDNSFFEGYGDFSRVGSGFWLVLQTMLLVAWAYDVNDGIMKRAAATDEEGNPKQGWLWLLFLIVIGLFTAEFTGMGLAVGQFGGDHCHRNNTFISISIVLTVVVGIAPVVVPRGSILASAIVCFYTTYLLLTALYSDPDQNCNQQFHEDNKFYIWTGIVISTITLCYGALSFQRSHMVTEAVVDQEYASDNKKSKKSANLLDSTEAEAAERAEHDEEDGEVYRDTEAAENAAAKSSVVRWEFVKFHLVMALASVYVAMLFTGWGELTQESNGFTHTNTTVWVNVLTQWATFGLYSWTLIAMAVYPDRFEYLDN